MEALLTVSLWTTAQTISITMLLAGAMFNPVREFCKYFEPPGNLTGRFGLFAQPYQ